MGAARADDDIAPFLAGPRSRLAELARVARISLEFVRGFRALHFVGPRVTVFGSARFPEHDDYRTARGVGACEAGGGASLGCNIVSPAE